MQLDNLTLLISIVSSVLASSGFWLYIIKRLELTAKKLEVKNNYERLLLGLAHDKITYLCNKAVRRGYISTSEYENLHKFLWEPYVDLGGNGTAKRLMDEVNKLPICEDLEQLEIQKGKNHESVSK